MLSYEELRHVTNQRRRERERDAQGERLAVQARAQRDRRSDETEPAAAIGLLLAARRQATQ